MATRSACVIETGRIRSVRKICSQSAAAAAVAPVSSAESATAAGSSRSRRSVASVGWRMTVQLLAQGGLGAPDGGADAAEGHVESGRDLGVAEAAVPKDEGHRLLAGQPGQG